MPGFGGSGPGHWQTVWQRDLAQARRVEQADWDAPRLGAWLATLKGASDAAPGSVIVAHSLGCILLAHLLAERPAAPVAAALLVAPADVESRCPAYEALREFAPIPLRRLPFPSTVVASSDDPFVSIERAAIFAERWGAPMIDIGPYGHVNVDAGFGPWPEGRAILDRLVRGL